MIEAGLSPLLKSASFCSVLSLGSPARPSIPEPFTALPLVPWQLEQVAARLRPRLGSAACAAPAIVSRQAAARGANNFIGTSPSSSWCCLSYSQFVVISRNPHPTKVLAISTRGCCIATILVVDYISTQLYIES